MKPKIYVSGPSRDLERCERAIALCIELGAEITYDWTVDVRANAGQSTPSDPDVQRTIALADLEGVAAADVVVFLDADNPSPGRWVEVGAAWGRSVPILASIPAGCRPYIWHQLMECTTSDESAIYRAVLVGRKRASTGRRCDPPDACADGGRCWTHSDWTPDEEARAAVDAKARNWQTERAQP